MIIKSHFKFIYFNGCLLNSPADMSVYQYNCAKNGKGLKIGTKDADNI